MPELAPTTSATWPVKSYGPVHGCFILAAQILVERPEDRIYDDIAAACNALPHESEVASSSKQPETGALGRPQTAQLSAKHDQP
jgi:hypothetical protein